jgi:hypothetical protein
MKRIGMFLFATALAGFAFISGPTPEAAAACLKPACFASPGCCIARECGSWCEGKGTPACGGNGSGGCCYCIPFGS